MKKEFITWWSEGRVGSIYDSTATTPLTCLDFFDYQKQHGISYFAAVVPTGIPYADLVGFANKKTKITIETIDD